MGQSNNQKKVALPEHSNGHTTERQIIELIETAIKQIRKQTTNIERKLQECEF